MSEDPMFRRVAEICRRHLTHAECMEVVAADPARVATNMRLIAVLRGEPSSELEIALAMLRAARMGQGGAS